LNQTIAGQHLYPRILVGEILDNDIHIVPNLGQVPIALALLRRQQDTGTDQFAVRMARNSLDIRRSFEIGEGLGDRTTGAGNGGAKQAFRVVHRIGRTRIFAIGQPHDRLQ